MMNHVLRPACLMAGLAAGLLLAGCESAKQVDDLAKPPASLTSSQPAAGSPKTAASADLSYQPSRLW